MNKLMVAIMALLGLGFMSSAASADTPHAGVASVSLGIDPSIDVQVAPLAGPSAAHPWGTVALAWHESSMTASTLHVGEWDLHARRMVRSVDLRSESLGLRAVRLAGAGRTLVVLSYDLAGGPAELLRLGMDLAVEDQLTLAEGSLASLVADERFVALGTFEPGGYHVRLIDTRTFMMVAARKLRGEGALTPWPVPARSAHALRIEGERLYVSIPDREPRLLALRLPSLADEAATTFPVPAAHRWAYTSVPLDATGSPLGFEIPDDGHFLLSPDLRSHRRTLTKPPPRWAPEEPRSGGERTILKVHGHTVITGVTAGRWVIAVSP